MQIDWVGKFTAAAGCAIYDGGTWPAEYNGDYFTTEPTMMRAVECNGCARLGESPRAYDTIPPVLPNKKRRRMKTHRPASPLGGPKYRFPLGLRRGRYAKSQSASIPNALTASSSLGGIDRNLLKFGGLSSGNQDQASARSDVGRKSGAQ